MLKRDRNLCIQFDGKRLQTKKKNLHNEERKSRNKLKHATITNTCVNTRPGPMLNKFMYSI